MCQRRRETKSPTKDTRVDEVTGAFSVPQGDLIYGSLEDEMAQLKDLEESGEAEVLRKE